MKNVLRIGVCGLFALTIATSGADDELPACESVGQLPYFNNRFDEFRLEKASLDDVFKRFGEAPRTTSKLAECCLQEGVCYLAPDRSKALDVGGWLNSPVTSYELTNDPKEMANYKECVVSDELSKPIASSTGVALGMSKKEVLGRLGIPKKVFSDRPDEIEYSFACRRTDLGSGWQTGVYIRVRFLDDKVILLTVQQSTQG